MNRQTKVIILVFILGLCLAWMFRYSAPVNVTHGVVAVTDRWTGCVVFHVFGASKDNKDYRPNKSCP